MIYFKDQEVYKKLEKIREYSLISLSEDKELVKLYRRLQNDEALKVHSKNVADMSIYLGIGYNFNLNELIELYKGALLHDIGKLNLNKEILYKKGTFTEDERLYTETHPAIGYKMLKDTSAGSIAVDIARSHHEKLDGSGYPNYLKGNEISIFTQIVTVTDMFEAMASERCYREALPEKTIYNILAKDKGINHVCVEMMKDSIVLNRKMDVKEMESRKLTLINGRSEDSKIFIFA